MIKYYAIIGKQKKGGYPQIIVTVEKTRIISQELTGKVYKTLDEANKDIFKLNCYGRKV